MFRKSVWLYAIGLFFISNSNADIQTFQSNLKNLDQSITANESALSALENGRNQFIKHIQENCRTTNGAKKYEEIRCSDYTKYSDLENSLKAYDASIAQSRKDLQKAKASYKASLDQAKKTLSPNEMLTLIEGSN